MRNSRRNDSTTAFLSSAIAALVSITAGCGGRIAPDGNAAPDTASDRVAILEARCAAPWKSSFSGGLASAPDTSVLVGRWLRCPTDGSVQQSHIQAADFDGVEFTRDNQDSHPGGADRGGTYYRLAIVGGMLERRIAGPGDSGAWHVADDYLLLERPPCAQPTVTDGESSCGGLESLVPMFESSPTRMWPYGSSVRFVKDE